MESPQFILSKLVNYTTASECKQKVKNNRYHYELSFGNSIGWDWLYGQIRKLNREVDVDIELWKLHPDGAVEVREIDRREDIDDSQHGLTDFE